ncbi:hypothetical protein B0H19DRAFT_1076007 [Mycena capillaripes]|nr:hypothetical protein B0H19DRAFT_1076007 [Mycena capillaripes]
MSSPMSAIYAGELFSLTDFTLQYLDGHGYGLGYKTANPDPNPENPNPNPRVYGLLTGRRQGRAGRDRGLGTSQRGTLGENFNVQGTKKLFIHTIYPDFAPFCSILTGTRGFGSGKQLTHDPYPPDRPKNPLGRPEPVSFPTHDNRRVAGSNLSRAVLGSVPSTGKPKGDKNN